MSVIDVMQSALLVVAFALLFLQSVLNLRHHRRRSIVNVYVSGDGLDEKKIAESVQRTLRQMGRTQ